MKLSRQRLSVSIQKKQRTPWYLAGGVSKDNCVAAYQFVNRASREVAMQNLNNLATHTLIDGVVAPYWTSNFGIFNGHTTGIAIYGSQYTIQDGYLVSDITPSNTGLWSFFIEYQYGTDTNKCIFGSRTTQIFGIYPRRTGNFVRFSNFKDDTTLPAIVDSNNVNYMGVANRNCYENGLVVKTLGSVITDTLPALWVLGGNGTGIPSDRSAVRRLSIYSTTITDAQILAITNAAKGNPNIDGPLALVDPIDSHANPTTIYVA